MSLHSIFHWLSCHKWMLESVVSGNKAPSEPTLMYPPGLSLLMVWYAFFIWGGQKITQPVSTTHISMWLFAKKVGIIALCVCTCVLPKRQENPPWISMKKPRRATCGRVAAAGWSGCNIPKLAMIAEYSERQVGTHLLMLFLHFISKSQREEREREASIKCIIWILVASTLHYMRIYKIHNKPLQ